MRDWKTSTVAGQPAALAAIVIGLLCGPATLWAQTPPPASDAAMATREREEDKPWNRTTTPEIRLAAKELFTEGNRLFRIPLFHQAAAKYTLALRTYDHPALHYNLALAQLNLGQDVDAREHLERALQYGADLLGTAQYEEGQRQLRELETQLGKITVSCPTPGTVVTLDGVVLFTAPGRSTAWVMPKTHEILARKQEYLSESRQITVASGATEAIELKLITLEEAADTSRRWATWKPWAVVGAGIAIAGGGGVFHLLSSRNEDQYGKEFLRLGCANTSDQAMPGCQDGQIPGDLSDRLARARQQQRIAIGAYVAGGSVVAVGVVLLALNRPRLTESGSTGPRVSLTPALAPDMLGVLVSISP